MAELTEFHPVHNVMLRKLRTISPLADEDGEARQVTRAGKAHMIPKLKFGRPLGALRHRPCHNATHE